MSGKFLAVAFLPTNCVTATFSPITLSVFMVLPLIRSVRHLGVIAERARMGGNRAKAGAGELCRRGWASGLPRLASQPTRVLGPKTAAVIGPLSV